MTIAELLNLITTTYNNEKGRWRALRGDRDDPPEIVAIKTILRNADQQRLVNSSDLENVMKVFLPLLKVWNISERPSARLRVFPVVMNALLKNLKPSVDVELNLTLEDIYTLESYKNFRCGNKGDSNDDLYLDVKQEASGASVLRYLVKTPNGVETVELLGSEYDSIKLTVAAQLQREKGISYGGNASYLILTLDEINLLMRETSKRGHFPLYENKIGSSIDQKKYSLLLLRKAGLLTAVNLKMIIDSSYSHYYLSFVKSLLTVHCAGVLTPENKPFIDKLFNPNIDSSNIETAQNFVLLEKAGQLSQEEKQLWISKRSNEVENRLKSLSILHKAGILTPANREIALTHYCNYHEACQGYYSYDSSNKMLPALAEGLVILDKAGLLTSDNIKIIQLQDYITKTRRCENFFDAPKYLAMIITLLQDIGIFTSDNIKKFIPEGEDVSSKRHPLNIFCKEGKYGFNNFKSLLCRLHRTNLLVDNFNVVLNNLACLIDCAVFSEIEYLPSHLFTQAMWNGIAARINEPNADVVVQKYLQNLRREAPERSRWEEEKYTETPKDDFDELIQIIEFAILAERDQISKSVLSRSSVTPPVQFEKIQNFLNALKQKDVPEVAAWLAENFDELNAGVMFSYSLKQKIAVVKPFGYSQLDELKFFVDLPDSSVMSRKFS